MTNLNEKQLITEIVGLARSQGLTVHSENAQLNETGMDFQVVFAKDDTGMPWVLRKPRRSDVVERASAEGITLAFLSANLTADVPDWRIHTPELIAYPMLKGMPAAGIDCNMYGIWIISRRQTTLSAHLPTYWPGFSSLIHGDLHPPHILIDQNERVTGLLDWTEAKVADPAKDFVLYQTIFGEKETARLLEYYNQAGGRKWAKMQEHISEMQAAYPVEIAKLALQTQQEEHINIGVTSD
ncbi:macrolide 2'-phosphotransferase [Bacillus subtilis]|nr:macrolide 2'-phosphotransferase [Bacillus subtilis]